MSSERLLGPDSPFDIDVTWRGDPRHPDEICVATRYATFTSRVEQSVHGQPEQWNVLETRPAFEVGFLKLIQYVPYILLMRKRRKATDAPRTKAPGGYLWRAIAEAAPEKILADTGVTFDFSTTRRLPNVIGHAEIQTPIELYYTFQWERTQDPREGVEVLEVPLSEAIEMASRGEIENDSSFSLLMWLWYLHTNRQL